MGQTNWWNSRIASKFGTPVDVYFNGQQDVEKGDVFAVQAGTPISVPVPSRVAWADAYQAVLQTPQGILNFLHVNTSVKTGQSLQPNQPIGVVTPNVGAYSDPNVPGSFYQSSGNVIEVGRFDTVQRAINRGNPSNQQDFTGIYNPSSVWKQFDMIGNAGSNPNSRTNYQTAYNPSNIGASTPTGTTVPGYTASPTQLPTSSVPLTTPNWTPPTVPPDTSLGSIAAPLGTTADQIGSTVGNAAGSLGAGLAGIASAFGIGTGMVIVVAILILVLLIKK